MKIELGRKFIRTNPDAGIYDIFVEIGKIQNHIIKSSKTLKKTIRNRIRRKSFNKVKVFKIHCQKILASL